MSHPYLKLRVIRLSIGSALFSFLLLPKLGRSDLGSPQEAVRLSKVIEQLSQDASVREKLLEVLDSFPDAWGLLGHEQRARLRDFILDRNWSGIDHFPALTTKQLRASVIAAGTAEKYANYTKRLAPPYVEVGPFTTDRGGEVDWWPPAADLEKTFNGYYRLGVCLDVVAAHSQRSWQ